MIYVCVCVSKCFYAWVKNANFISSTCPSSYTLSSFIVISLPPLLSSLSSPSFLSLALSLSFFPPSFGSSFFTLTLFLSSFTNHFHLLPLSLSFPLQGQLLLAVSDVETAYRVIHFLNSGIVLEYYCGDVVTCYHLRGMAQMQSCEHCQMAHWHIQTHTHTHTLTTTWQSWYSMYMYVLWYYLVL